MSSVVVPAGMLMKRSMTGPVNITRDGFATRAHVMRTWEGAPVAWEIEPAPDSIAVTGVNGAQFLESFLSVLER